jgi:hypothetical protein
LLEEERHVGSATSFSDLQHPFLLQRSCSRSTFAAADLQEPEDFSIMRAVPFAVLREILELDMQAIKARFDGKTIKVPKELRKAPPGEVLVIIQEPRPDRDESMSWLKAQETAFAKVWENDEDAVYDSL